jgi:hypothetical protein
MQGSVDAFVDNEIKLVALITHEANEAAAQVGFSLLLC